MAVSWVGLALSGDRDLVVDVTGLSIRGPRTETDGFFIVIRGTDEEGTPVVAFHDGATLEDALLGVHNRLSNGTFKWRVDEYAKG